MLICTRQKIKFGYRVQLAYFFFKKTPCAKGTGISTPRHIWVVKIPQDFGNPLKIYRILKKQGKVLPCASGPKHEKGPGTTCDLVVIIVHTHPHCFTA